MKRLFLPLLSILFFGEAVAQKTANVILEHSETLSFDKTRGNNLQVLKGDVKFRHENAVMYCDSAYFYNEKNSFDAFGNVRVIQDSMTLTAARMFYDGNIRLLKARGNVVMKNGELTVYTETLDFDRAKNFGYYFNGGRVTDAQVVITSTNGYYYPDTKNSVFQEKVVLTNPDFVIHTDTLHYSTISKVLFLNGPSYIYHGKYTVYTTKGWANTDQNYGALYDYSVITSNDGKRMTADSITFNRQQGWAKAYHNIDAQDSVRKNVFRGNYGIFHENPQSGFITDKACMIDYSSADTLFLHADTLSFATSDSTDNRMKAYYNVRFFRTDFQGKCDSMIYLTTDSMVYMYGDPVLWSDENQLNGDVIEIYMVNNAVDQIHITANAMIASIENYEQKYYNQLSGRESKGYMIGGELRKVDMIGNAVSIYFSKDNDEPVGINKAEGSLMTIFLKNKKLEKIIMTPDSKGVLYPPDKMPQEELFLRNFTWQEEIRPKNKEDIFRKNK